MLLTKKENVQCGLHRFQTIYQTLEDTVSAADAEDDLKWFRSNHGPGMPMNWPQFEVCYSLDLHEEESRRNHKEGLMFDREMEAKHPLRTFLWD